MIYPKLNYKIDIKEEQEICFDFINDKIGCFDFGKERILDFHPELIPFRDKPKYQVKRKINDYVKNYYSKNQERIERDANKMKVIWDNIADIYFKELEELFGELSFYSEKEIFFYPSIFKCGVLFDDGKSFQIWHKTVKEPNEVKRHFAHEILHFYYYAYLKKEGLDDLIKNWEKAEIFNVIVLTLPQFKKIIGKKETGYEIHEKHFKDYQGLWDKSINLKDYLRKSSKI